MWKLLMDLQLWWLDLQLEGFKLSAFLAIVLLVAGVVAVLVGIKVAIWRGRMKFATGVLSSATFLFPPRTIRVTTVAIVAFAVAGALFLWLILT
jgi:hypothetical protein